MFAYMQINKARIICDCLIASEGIDLKFEEAFCLFLLGQVHFLLFVSPFAGFLLLDRSGNMLVRRHMLLCTSLSFSFP